MQKYTLYILLAGIILIIGGAIFYLIKPVLIIPRTILLLAGFIMVLLYVYTNYDYVKSLIARRTMKHGVNTAVMIIILIVIIVFVEAISASHSKRFDLTETKRYSLSDQSVKILKNLKKDVKAYGFFRPDQPNKRPAEDLLKQYSYYSNKFKYEIIDPDRNPGMAKRFQVTSYGTIVVESGTRDEKLTDSQEEKITNAIIKVTREGERIVYFLKGHGENDIANTDKLGYSGVKEAIEKSNFKVKDLLLMRENKIPDDAAILVVGGPKKDLFQNEIDAIENYIKNGGKIFFMIDPFSIQGLRNYLAKYGFDLREDIIVDRLSRIFGGDFLMPVVTQYEPHPVTKDFNIASFFPLVRSVEVQTKLPPGITAQSLAKTGPGSWAETDRAALEKGEASLDEKRDKKGPVSIAAVATVDVSIDKDRDKEKGKETEKKPQAKIVVFGDSEFASNNYLNLSGNRDLFLNVISYLGGEEDLISVRPKDKKSTPVFLTALQGKLIFYLPVVVLPGVILVIGIYVTSRRRWAR